MKTSNAMTKPPDDTNRDGMSLREVDKKRGQRWRCRPEGRHGGSNDDERTRNMVRIAREMNPLVRPSGQSDR